MKSKFIACLKIFCLSFIEAVGFILGGFASMASFLLLSESLGIISITI